MQQSNKCKKITEAKDGDAQKEGFMEELVNALVSKGDDNPRQHIYSEEEQLASIF